MKCIFILLFFSIIACGKKSNAITPSNIDTSSSFDSIPVTKKVNPPISEASGIADSKAFPGFLWAEEDSGNPPQLSLVGHDGTVNKKVHIKGAVNRDWEDMAILGDTLYIADIGDNLEVSASYKIYTLAEPKPEVDTAIVVNEIEFKYADGSHDAEAFIVDPLKKDIYIITKRQNPSKVYKITFPYSYSSINTAYPVATLAFSGVVSAAIAKSGKEIIVKTYTSLNYFTIKSNSIPQSLQQPFTLLPYVLEPQGEAVTFANDNRGYFTLSEKGFLADQKLYYYKRR